MLRCCATLVLRTRLHMCLYSLVSHNTFSKKKNLLAVAVWSKAETPFPQRKVFTAIWLHFLEPSSSSKTAAALACPLISSAAANVCKLVFSPTSCSCSSACPQSADWLHSNEMSWKHQGLGDFEHGCVISNCGSQVQFSDV